MGPTTRHTSNAPSVTAMFWSDRRVFRRIALGTATTGDWRRFEAALPRSPWLLRSYDKLIAAERLLAGGHGEALTPTQTARGAARLAAQLHGADSSRLRRHALWAGSAFGLAAAVTAVVLAVLPEREAGLVARGDGSVVAGSLRVEATCVTEVGGERVARPGARCPSSGSLQLAYLAPVGGRATATLESEGHRRVVVTAAPLRPTALLQPLGPPVPLDQVPPGLSSLRIQVQLDGRPEVTVELPLEVERQP